VHGGHEAFDNAEFVIDDLGEWCQTVSRAAGVGDDSLVAGVCLMVDSHDEHGDVVLWWGRDDYLLGSAT